MQWDDTENAGFSKAEPWFYVNPNYKEINVAAQEKDPDSILNFYKKAIRLRKELPVVRFGSYKEHFRLNGKQYVYTREMSGQKLLVICSFSEKPVRMKVPKSFEISKAGLILTNCNNDSETLQPYECRVYLLDE